MLWSTAQSTSVTLSVGGPSTPAENSKFWHPKLAAKLELRIYEYITELAESGFHLLKPMYIELTPAKKGRWIAYFPDANISISGSSQSDAKAALVSDILDTMEMLVDREDSLILALQRQLDVLRQYIEVKI